MKKLIACFVIFSILAGCNTPPALPQPTGPRYPVNPGIPAPVQPASAVEISG